MKIAVLGLWHLGEIYSACLADMGHTVFCVSEDTEVIKNFKKNIPPLIEPGLAPLLQKNQKKGTLTYTTDFNAIKKYDTVWICFDTPVTRKDEADITPIIKCFKKIVPLLKQNVLITVSSQLPVGTSRELTALVRAKRPDLIFRYAYVPENLRLGEAVESFMSPGRIVIGSDDSATQQAVKRLFRGIKADFLLMNTASAEMVKHALNAFLATSLSFIYDIADVCEVVGADVTEVSRALKSDPRIGGKAYLDASIGFSGGTLGRDLQYLSREAKRNSFSVPVIESVYQKNAKRSALVFRALEEALGTLRGKKITLWGVTYKSGTPTLRRSLALEIARGFVKRGAILSFADPLAKKEDVAAELPKTKYEFSRSPLRSGKDAHAIVVITPWKELEKINFKRLRATMKRPALLFDARNFFAEKRDVIKEVGILYRGVGVKM